MTIYNNIFYRKSQGKSSLFLISYLTIAIILFAIILFLDATVYMKLLLALLVGLSPVFLYRPLYFLFFIFLITPSLRDLSETIIIGNYNDIVFNFNFILDLAVIIFGGLFLLRNLRQIIDLIKKYRVIALFLLFIIFSLISIFYSIDKSSSLIEASRIIIIFILFVYSILAVENKKHFYQLTASLLVGSLIPCLIAFYEFFTASGWWDKTIMAFRADGTFSHPATLAFYLLCTAPIIYALMVDKIGKNVKVILAILLISNLFITLITLTRGAWIGLLVMLLVFGLFKSRKFLVAIAALIFMVYLFSPAINQRVNDVFNPKYNSSLITRLKIIQTTLPAFKNAPIFGYGFGNFDIIHLKYNTEAKTYESLQAHNDYLRLLIELGIIGLILYLSIFISLFILIYKLYKTGDKYNKNYLFSLIILWLGILAISTGDNILRTMPVQFLIWGYTGAVLAYTNLK